MDSDNILEIDNLKVSFFTEEGEVRAVDGVSINIPRGKIVALVGESGSGKSVTSYSVLRLIQKPGEIVGGEIRLGNDDGTSVDILGIDGKSDTLYDIRGNRISMIFQEPMTALSPVHTIGNQICEALHTHQEISKKDAEAIAVEALRQVGIPGPESRLNQYPFELSGGMRQRVVIAMALVCKPDLLIADEPTTALDVTIQAQIMSLMKNMQKDSGTSVLLITHDLGVVAQMADEVAVMYLGRIVEKANVFDIMESPRHPYTQGLLNSLPSRHQNAEELPSIIGSVPSMSDIPTGCPFHPRCPYAKEGVCDIGEVPPIIDFSEGHDVACLRVVEILEETQNV